MCRFQMHTVAQTNENSELEMVHINAQGTGLGDNGGRPPIDSPHIALIFGVRSISLL
jgi:hypothetical protein